MLALQITTRIGDHPVLVKPIIDIPAILNLIDGLTGVNGLSDPRAFRWRIVGVGIDELGEILRAIAMVDGMTEVA